MTFEQQRRRWLIGGATALGIVAVVAAWTARDAIVPTSDAHDSAAVPADSALPIKVIAAKTMAATVQIRALDALGRERGAGTGFFVSANGMVATSLHVIRGAHSVQVETLYGKTYDSVSFVGGDGKRDLALLRVNATEVQPLPLATGPDPDVGERVFATGNPLGQTGTFSDGLVSARRAAEGTTFIQISAPIAPGSSGGPVVNDRGQVLGITTVRLQGGLNINFGVPARYLKRLLDSAAAPAHYARALLPPLQRPPLLVNDPSAVQSGHVDDSERDVIARQLRKSDSLVQEHRGDAEGEAITGALAQGDSLTRTLRFAMGRDYLIAGYCDEHCGSLSLTLRSASGKVMDQDVEVDDTPKLRFTAPHTGSYTLVIGMSDCDEKTCRLGVRSYSMRQDRTITNR